MRTDFGMGVSLLKREDESLQDYFLSFSPLAPFFGVAWRFAPMVGASAALAPESPAKPVRKPASAAAPAAPAAKPARAKVAVDDAVELSAEAAPLTEAAPGAPAPKSGPEAPAPKSAPEAPSPISVAVAEVEPAVADDLTAIKGVGPKLSRQLNEMGLFTYAQIAALTAEDLTRIDAHLTGVNKGSAERNDWIGQAKALAEG